MLLEEEAQIQQRFFQYLVVAEDERDQQPPHASVAVQEWVDGFELGMGKTGLEQWRNRLVVEEFFQFAKTGQHFMGGRRHKSGIARHGAADPVLGRAELSWILREPLPGQVRLFAFRAWAPEYNLCPPLQMKKPAESGQFHLKHRTITPPGSP